MISFMKKLTVSIIYILTLSGCGLEQDSYLVRWWNGNIPTELYDKEKKYGIFVVKIPKIYQKILKRKRKNRTWN